MIGNEFYFALREGSFLPDRPGGGILEAEHLGQHHRIVIFQEHADLLHHLVPHFVHAAGDLHGAHLVGPQVRLGEVGQVQEADTAFHPLFFQALGQEGGKEIVIAYKIDDEDLASYLR